MTSEELANYVKTAIKRNEIKTLTRAGLAHKEP
jgi:hypothetical protein